MEAEDEEIITVEGIIEDIDVENSSGVKAVQCKYHEASTSFAPSKIYKPILQMLKDFSNKQKEGIRYILFAYFPDIRSMQGFSIDKCFLQSVLATDNKELKKYTNVIPENINLESFLDCFSFELGPSYDEITEQVKRSLGTLEMQKGDIQTIVYPNAIHNIATISTKHDAEDRKITKRKFLSDLSAIRKTAITQWTLSLKSRDILLREKRKQLKKYLGMNARCRCIVMNPDDIEDYEKEKVFFIRDFIEKYHYKPAHIRTPILCLCAERTEILDIQHRLFSKGIITNDGYVGGVFEERYFLRNPLLGKSPKNCVKREFSLRIIAWNDHGRVLNDFKCDDLFIIGNIDFDGLDKADINVECLKGVTFKEIKYIFGVSDVYE